MNITYHNWEPRICVFFLHVRIACFADTSNSSWWLKDINQLGPQNHNKNLSNQRLRKWVSLLMLVAQTVSVVFAMRLSRTLAVEGAWLPIGNIQLLDVVGWLVNQSGGSRCFSLRLNRVYHMHADKMKSGRVDGKIYWTHPKPWKLQMCGGL